MCKISFYIAETATKKLDNGQPYFNPQGKDYFDFNVGAYDALDLQHPERYMFYHKYLNVDGSYLMFIPNELFGALKGTGYSFADFSQGMTALLTEPSEVWKGVKAMASEPGKTLSEVEKAAVTQYYLYALNNMAGDDAEAEAIRVHFWINAVTGVYGVAKLPSLAKDVVGAAGSAIKFAAGVGDAVPIAVQLTRDVILADGTLLKGGSTLQVTEYANGFKLITAEGETIAIPKPIITTVDQPISGIEWGKGIKGQGLPFEDYLDTQLPAGTRLPEGFKTFDFFDKETGLATSAKTTGHGN